MPRKDQQGGDGTRHDDRATNAAWRKFASGALDSAGAAVRSAIYKSWVRSTSAGIDPGCGHAPSAEGDLDVERLQRANRELFRAARGSIEKIGRMLHGTEAMLVLTDARGLVLEQIGDPNTIREGERINLHVGGLWNEDAVGTNGIGTALWAGEPMFVHGSEHYVETLKDWSCAAAPIRNPLDQSVIGAVDLSGLTRIFRQHNTAFAAAAAGEIQAALTQALNEECIRLLDALIEQVPVAGKEDGIVILDRTGRVLHRSGFERLILPDGTELDTRMGKQLVRLTGEPTPVEVARLLPRELGCREVSNLEIEGEVRGIALVVDCGTRPRRPARPAPQARADVQHGAGFIAASPVMLETIDLARRVARVNAPVLVQGETGTGKELLARLIHAEHSTDGKKPFVAINCGAISRELFGGELFGHVEGAFTGAVRAGKAGKLEEAGNGVFCLDEIGEMPLEIQPYLLRVLEECVVYRIGDSRPRPFNARLVALTNRDLGAEVEAGRFRRDLFYRINAVTVRVPPLRERGDDILLLADHFNRKVAADYGLEPLRFSAEVTDLFLRYRWPGNVRELRNLMQRLHPAARRDISLGDLPQEITAVEPAAPPQPGQIQPGQIQPAQTPPKPASNLREAERDVILRALDEHNGNLSRVAEQIGITRPTLYRKLRLYGIERIYR